MKLRPEEITSILKQRIEQYDVETDLAEVGTVLQVGDGIARIYGLENCVSLELLEGADLVRDLGELQQRQRRVLPVMDDPLPDRRQQIGDGVAGLVSLLGV